MNRPGCRSVIALVVAVVAPSGVAVGQQDRPPNVVIIVADDLGYNELGSYGQEKIRTPNLDRLAEQGARLTRYYAGSPVCAPSRAVLMTGLHTGHSPIRGNREMGGWGPEQPEGQWPIPASFYLLPERMQRLGYTTGLFGKWGLGGPGSVGHPSFQGIDHFYGYLCQRVAHNYYPTHLWRNHDVDVLDNNSYFAAHQRIDEAPEGDQGWERFEGGDYAPAEIIDELLGWTRDQIDNDQPFMLNYWSVIPHLALSAPDDFIDAYPAEWDAEPYLGDKGYLPSKRPRATYAAMITYLDDCVGLILDLLDETGQADNTIVIFTSDNGTSWVGGVDMEFFDSLGELRGRKATLWEGGIRVPMIVRWPGRVTPGSVVDHVCAAEDLLPTILEAVGGEAPTGLDGLSFVNAITAVGGQPTHEVLYWEFPEGPQQQAVLIEGRWKAIRPNLRKGSLVIELYDLAADPGETTDVAADNAAIVERAERLMESLREPSELFPIAALDDE